MDNRVKVNYAEPYPPVSGMRPAPPERQILDVLRRENRRLRRENARMMAERRASLVDPATGLHNRQYFDRRLGQEFARAQRHELPLSLVVLQLGRLREIRDEFGDTTVTRLVRWVVDTMVKTCREFDEPCLIGDDEVAIILPHTGPEGAEAFTRRLARKVASAASRADSVPDGAHIELSFGLAAAPDDAETPLELVMAAEEALYFERGAKSRRGEEVAA